VQLKDKNKMALKDWKKRKVDKWRTLWTKGKFVIGRGYPDWIHISKTSLIGEYEVGAKRKINNKTLNGHFIYFVSKPSSVAKKQALAYAKGYMKKH